MRLANHNLNKHTNAQEVYPSHSDSLTVVDPYASYGRVHFRTDEDDDARMTATFMEHRNRAIQIHLALARFPYPRVVRLNGKRSCRVYDTRAKLKRVQASTYSTAWFTRQHAICIYTEMLVIQGNGRKGNPWVSASNVEWVFLLPTHANKPTTTLGGLSMWDAVLRACGQNSGMCHLPTSC